MASDSKRDSVQSIHGGSDSEETLGISKDKAKTSTIEECEAR